MPAQPVVSTVPRSSCSPRCESLRRRATVMRELKREAARQGRLRCQSLSVKNLASFHRCKSKQICATVCRHRGAPRISAKSFSQNNFR